MSRKAAVFYLSLKKAPDRTSVMVGTSLVYVRGEVHTVPDDDDLTDVLDKAHARDDEDVMNSHYVEEE